MSSDLNVHQGIQIYACDKSSLILLISQTYMIVACISTIVPKSCRTGIVKDPEGIRQGEYPRRHTAKATPPKTVTAAIVVVKLLSIHED